MGAQAELRALIELPGMTGPRARALHNAGLKGPEQLVAAKEETLHRALLRGLPRSMRRVADDSGNKGPLTAGERKAQESSASSCGLLVARAAKRLVDAAQALLRDRAEAAERALCQLDGAEEEGSLDALH